MIAKSPGMQFSGRRSHPVGVDYLQSYYRSQMGHRKRLMSPTMLDERVKLYNGNIECLTCHSLRSERRAMLVMSNRLSRLCLSCHDI